ncbi:MAG: glycosyltransferase family 2 protein [Simkaniaceae bacterium]|nr:glycosyltransferase family 2 protein [Simkaniaceae bacterium]
MSNFLMHSFAVLLLFFTFPSFASIKKNPFNIAKTSSEIAVSRKFVVFVPSFNNEKFCEKNLQSIFDQTYENYRVVYIDDCSTDETFKRVSKIVSESGKMDKVIIVRNPVNQKNLNNLYDCAHKYCSDDEIIVNLDGDDFFAHSDVLKHLNAYYQSDDVWVTWGSYIHWSTGAKGKHSRPVRTRALQHSVIRNLPYCYSHLKTFYAKLFKNIKREHLMFNNKFIQLAPDLPTMLPLIEMARTHAFFIPEVLYIYNDQNSLSEHHVVRRQDYQDVFKYVFSLPAYEAIQKRDW